MLDGPVVVKDNALARTSAWAGCTFLGRDHLARQDTAGEVDPRRRRNRHGGRFRPIGRRRLVEMAYANLEEKLQALGGAMEMARNSQIGPYVYPAVPAEFSNWRERVAWRETSASMIASHAGHSDRGPDTIKLLSDLGVNSFATFAVNKAEATRRVQPRRPCDRRRDLFYLEENRVRLVGRPSAHNWVRTTPRPGTTTSRCRGTSEPPSTPRGDGRSTASRCRARRRSARPRANGGSLPEIKFFNMGELTLGVRGASLHHGMSGVPGLELWGPWEEREDVRGAIVPGRPGLRPQAGRLTRVYATNSSPAGSRARCRRSSRATTTRRTAGSSPPTATRAGLARRRLLRGRHLRLLPDAARPQGTGRS